MLNFETVKNFLFVEKPSLLCVEDYKESLAPFFNAVKYCINMVLHSENLMNDSMEFNAYYFKKDYLETLDLLCAVSKKAHRSQMEGVLESHNQKFIAFFSAGLVIAKDKKSKDVYYITFDKMLFAGSVKRDVKERARFGKSFSMPLVLNAQGLVAIPKGYEMVGRTFDVTEDGVIESVKYDVLNRKRNLASENEFNAEILNSIAVLSRRSKFFDETIHQKLNLQEIVRTKKKKIVLPASTHTTYIFLHVIMNAVSSEFIADVYQVNDKIIFEFAYGENIFPFVQKKIKKYIQTMVKRDEKIVICTSGKYGINDVILLEMILCNLNELNCSVDCVEITALTERGTEEYEIKVGFLKKP